jgi:hypothetical protein
MAIIQKQGFQEKELRPVRKIEQSVIISNQ